MRDPANALDWRVQSKNSFLFALLIVFVFLVELTLAQTVQDCELRCSAGEYYNSSKDACILCPPGFFCPVNSSSPFACPPGSSSGATGASNMSTCQPCLNGTFTVSSGSSKCTPCPAGSACASPSGLPVLCAGGSFAGIGSSICSSCDEGHYSVPGSATCLPCPGGYSCLKNGSSIVPCPQGTFSPAGVSSCQVCSPGSYSLLSASTSCNVCEPGFACPTSTQRILCLPGSYSSLGSLNCTKCPAGSFCTDPSLPPTSCVPGSYSTLGSSFCKLCPAGFSCPVPSSSPILCSPGLFAPQNSSICQSCLPGSWTNETGSTSCFPSSAGFYCPRAGMVTQLRCPAGTVSLSTGQSSCSLCPNGTRPSSSQSSCVPCNAGTFCLQTNGEEIPCPSGTFSGAGSASCTVCPAGSFCATGVSSPTPCPSGTYSLSGYSSCIKCPAGFSCNTSGTFLCPMGTYSPRGDTNCQACPPGSRCPDAARDPIPCNDGTYSLGSSNLCALCPSGFSCVTKNMPPVPCGQGTYSLEGMALCESCLAGFRCSNSSTPPVPCSPGQYSFAGSVSCQDCPSGFYCPLPNRSPIECPSGYTSVSRQSNCSVCPPGYACPNAANPSTAVPCLPGTFSPGAQTTCTACPPSFACPFTDRSTLIPCGNGTYSSGSQSSCTVCPAGFACPNIDGSGISPCVDGFFSAAGDARCHFCPAGFECPSPGRNMKIPCKPGSYSGGGRTFCSLCNPGFFCPRRDALLELSCTAGTFSIGNQTECTPCPAGHFCPTFSGFSAQVCPDGTYSLGRQQSCTRCPAGRYCPVKDAPPLPCPRGYYSLGDVTQCTICPAGHACGDPSVVPFICPQGFWAPAGEVICRPCSSGYFCDASGSTTPTPTGNECPVGYYCPLGSVFPIPCPTGTFGNIGGARSRDEGCYICPPGRFCPLASTSASVCSAAQPCPLGFYCPPGAAQAMSCPAGTYQPTTEAKSIDDCLNCPSGSYCPNPAAAPLNCERGHYCPIRTRTFLQYPCPAGTYNPDLGKSAISDCLVCPKGRYCPSGSTSPIACRIGTYNPISGGADPSSCLLCEPGFSCPTTGLLVSNSTNCSPGHYCPRGTGNPTTFSCPPGTYTDSVSLDRVGLCSICPRGKFCPAGTGGSSNPPQNCSSGHFCPGSPPGVSITFESFSSPRATYATEFPCPPGTFSNSTSLFAMSGCSVCPSGQFCRGGASQPSGPCKRGHFCPPGTKFEDEFPCPAGTFGNRTSLTSATECFSCLPGSFCPEGSPEPIGCYPGTFSNFSGAREAGPAHDASSKMCLHCPPGYECPRGTSDPIPCSPGRFSSLSSRSCAPCPAGSYCPQSAVSDLLTTTSFLCPAGLYCPSGLDLTPSLATHACPAGRFCPAGTKTPLRCPVGTFNPVLGKSQVSDCLLCEAGKYCVEGSVNASELCSPGHFCPPGSSGPFQEPCPGGTYSSDSGTNSSSSCLQCVGGFYCPRGSSNPRECPRGSYCNPGTEYPIPCPLGTFGNITGLTSISACFDCPPGMFCDGLGLVSPRGLCDAGFFCRNRAYTSAPIDRDAPTGGICMPGGYCPVGSAFPLPCPAGTFNNKTGARSPLECVSCTPGFFCPGTSSSTPTGLCAPGYYCTGGAATPFQHIAPLGYFTVSGSSAPLPCERGTYAPVQGLGECIPCPAGTFCSTQALATHSICPQGFYCPRGTAVPIRCPAGTFGPSSGLVNRTQCEDCPPGFFCASTGLPAPSGPCSPGFFCSSRSTESMPVLRSFGSECPAGAFCGNATGVPAHCPPGTYQPTTRASVSSQCIPCPAARYCSQSGLVSWEGNCNPGFFCTSGSSSPSPSSGPTGGPCPIGHYCPEASPAPIPCPPGQYQNSTGRSSCSLCPAGFFCPGLGVSVPTVCPSGRFCPTGSPNPINKCPIGTYGNETGYSASFQCIRCMGGFYCSVEGLSSPNGICSAGYFCYRGARDGQGNVNPLVGGTGGMCPQGTYCSVGSSLPLLCPPGTFSQSTAATSVSACRPCSPGFYCNGSGLISPRGLCESGFFCRNGSAVSRPFGFPETVGSICPRGHFCPKGSSEPIPCPPGMYSNVSGASSCSICPAGFFCTGGVDDYAKTPCPPGFFCPQGSQISNGHMCPNGTFANRTGLSSQSECTICPPGSFCSTPGLSAPTGLCSGGYVCLYGSDRSDPDNGKKGYRCPKGYFCPIGSSSPRPCPGGYFCGSVSLSAPSGLCHAGFFCSGKAISPSPIDPDTGGLCPRGHFCPAGIESPIRCPQGTFSPVLGSSNLTSCQRCSPGTYCNTTGLVTPSGPCSPGFYCPGGISTPTPADFICPLGHFCRNGTASPIPCPEGYHQPQRGQPHCFKCPPGHFCPSYTVDTFLAQNRTFPLPTVCPAGHYCPLGAASFVAYPCPNGTFSNATSLFSASQCLPCPPGKFCSHPGLVMPIGQCSAGFVCTGGSTTPTPSDNIQGYICPPGSYCPIGALSPIPCPAGSFSVSPGSGNSSSCLPCLPGRYCDAAGQTEGSTGLCSGGYVCLGGSPTPKPAQKPFGFLCPPGTFCPNGTLSTLACRRGTYNPDFGKSFCLDCPAGTYCPYLNMTSFSECPAGHYCPVGSQIPTPCPQGTFNNHTGQAHLSSCILCPVGFYCDREGLASPMGHCAAGHFCAPGSATKAPLALNSFPLSGKCPSGHYCLSGTSSPVACPAGTFLNATIGKQASDCLPCPPRMFCPLSGRSSPAGICSPGFFCPIGQQTSSPPSLACPRGHFCPAGSALPVGCPDAFYQDQEGKSSCKPCPAGYFCRDNASSPLLCPPRFFCGNETRVSGFPSVCPPGTHGVSVGLSSSSQCQQCPAGRYCVNGSISGDCSAGYICWFGNFRPDPSPQSSRGALCPPGFYCPGGTLAPIPCQNGTIRLSVGGAVASDCTPCPAGFVCVSSIASPCPPGFYCPFGSVQIRCPRGTYNNIGGASNATECSPCPSGFLCPNEGTSTFQDNPCPPGHFCPPGSISPVECPATTFRNITNGRSISDCFECPAGRLCFNRTVIPRSCPSQYFCPPGSMLPRACPSGFYCPVNTGNPLVCPPGNYCPNKTEIPIPCPRGFYCEGGNRIYEQCPLGTYSPEFLSDRSSLDSSCLSCPPGTAGVDPLRFSCPTCRAGHICEGRSTLLSPTIRSQHRGYICPRGFYCPAGALAPLSCPVGTFGDRTGIGDVLNCTSCPAGQFNDRTGQTGCFPCGSSSFSLAGATSCTCNGTNRVFQKSDGSCICEPGYEFINEQFVIASDVDGIVACQPIVYGRCSGNQRRNSTGSCVPRDACSGACISGAGFIDPVTGICECSGIQNENEICDEICRQQRIRGFVDPRTRQIRITNPTTGASYPFNVTAISSGEIDCLATGLHGSSSQCVAIFMFASERGLRGIYSPSLDYIGGVLNGSSTSTLVVQMPSSSALSSSSDESGAWTLSSSLEPSAGARTYARDAIADGSSVIEHGHISFGARRSIAKEINATNHSPSQDSNHTLNSAAHFSPRPSSAGSGGYLAKIRSKGVTSSIQNDDVYDSWALRFRRPSNKRTLLQSSPDSSFLPMGVDQPIVCLEFGQTVIWDVSHPSREFYPVYLKSSLLNSNPSFDFGSFRELSDLMRSNLTIRTFAFTFNEEGSYVFASAHNLERTTIIAVLKPNARCPSSAFLVPQTASNLVSLGLNRRTGLLLSPDWILIGILLGGIIFLLVAVIGSFYWFQKKAWGRGEASIPKYRIRALSSSMEKYASKGTTTSRQLLYKKIDHSKISNFIGRVDGDEVANTQFLNSIPVQPELDIDTVEPVRKQPSLQNVNSRNKFASFASLSDTRIDGKSPNRSFLAQHREQNVLSTEALYGKIAFIDEGQYYDRFWDFERQIDLEEFSTTKFYSKLNQQTKEIGNRISRSGELAINLYEKVAKDVRKIRNLLGQQDEFERLAEEDLPEDRTVDEVRASLETETALRDLFDGKVVSCLRDIKELMVNLDHSSGKMVSSDADSDTDMAIRQISNHTDSLVRKCKFMQELAAIEFQRRSSNRKSFQDSVGERLAHQVESRDKDLVDAMTVLMDELEDLKDFTLNIRQRIEEERQYFEEQDRDGNNDGEETRGVHVSVLAQLDEELKIALREFADQAERPVDGLLMILDGVMSDQKAERAGARKEIVDLIKSLTVRIALDEQTLSSLIDRVSKALKHDPVTDGKILEPDDILSQSGDDLHDYIPGREFSVDGYRIGSASATRAIRAHERGDIILSEEALETLRRDALREQMRQMVEEEKDQIDRDFERYRESRHQVHEQERLRLIQQLDSDVSFDREKLTDYIMDRTQDMNTLRERMEEEIEVAQIEGLPASVVARIREHYELQIKQLNQHLKEHKNELERLLQRLFEQRREEAQKRLLERQNDEIERIQAEEQKQLIELEAVDCGEDLTQESLHDARLRIEKIRKDQHLSLFMLVRQQLTEDTIEKQREDDREMAAINSNVEAFHELTKSVVLDYFSSFKENGVDRLDSFFSGEFARLETDLSTSPAERKNNIKILRESAERQRNELSQIVHVATNEQLCKLESEEKERKISRRRNLQTRKMKDRETEAEIVTALVENLIEDANQELMEGILSSSHRNSVPTSSDDRMTLLTEQIQQLEEEAVTLQEQLKNEEHKREITEQALRQKEESLLHDREIQRAEFKLAQANLLSKLTENEDEGERKRILLEFQELKERQDIMKKEMRDRHAQLMRERIEHRRRQQTVMGDLTIQEDELVREQVKVLQEEEILLREQIYKHAPKGDDVSDVAEAPILRDLHPVISEVTDSTIVPSFVVEHERIMNDILVQERIELEELDREVQREKETLDHRLAKTDTDIREQLAILSSFEDLDEKKRRRLEQLRERQQAKLHRDLELRRQKRELDIKSRKEEALRIAEHQRKLKDKAYNVELLQRAVCKAVEKGVLSEESRQQALEIELSKRHMNELESLIRKQDEETQKGLEEIVHRLKIDHQAALNALHDRLDSFYEDALSDSDAEEVELDRQRQDAELRRLQELEIEEEVESLGKRLSLTHTKDRIALQRIQMKEISEVLQRTSPEYLRSISERDQLKQQLEDLRQSAKEEKNRIRLQLEEEKKIREQELQHELEEGLRRIEEEKLRALEYARAQQEKLVQAIEDVKDARGEAAALMETFAEQEEAKRVIMDANKRRAQEKIAEMKRKQLEKRIAAQRETIQRQEAEEEAIRTRQKAEQQARSVDRKRSSKNAAQRWNDRTASVRHRSRKTTSFSTQEFESLDIPSVVDENDALSGTRLDIPRDSSSQAFSRHSSRSSSFRRLPSIPSRQISSSNSNSAPSWDPQRWFSILCESPLFEKLHDIERLLSAAVDEPMKPNMLALDRGSSIYPSFLDPRDMMWLREGLLRVIDSSALDQEQMLLYAFADHVFEILQAEHGSEKGCSVMLASSLPDAAYVGNAYKNSYHYDGESSILFIRLERLSNPGSLSLILCHAFAHIVTNDMTNDSSPQFVRMFHHFISVLLMDFFKYKRKRKDF